MDYENKSLKFKKWHNLFSTQFSINFSEIFGISMRKKKYRHWQPIERCLHMWFFFVPTHCLNRVNSYGDIVTKIPALLHLYDKWNCFILFFFSPFVHVHPGSIYTQIIFYSTHKLKYVWKHLLNRLLFLIISTGIHWILYVWVRVWVWVCVWMLVPVLILLL